MAYRLSDLDQLEAESITILREVVAGSERPVLLYSVGKDSSVLLWLLRKAFAPGPVPLPLLHVDTTFKFDAMYAFRDAMVARLGLDLRVHKQRDAVAQGANPRALGTARCCGLWKTRGLLDALAEGGYDAAIGGARRDEERSRAKERVVSVRDAHGQWDPRRQRPEPWTILNLLRGPGETLRVFPLSSWTELDVWRYVDREAIPVVPLYFAEPRRVVIRAGQLVPIDDRAPPWPGEQVEVVTCRFRTLGCVPCSGAVRSSATTVGEIVAELEGDRGSSERAGRLIDHDQAGSMEKKKREGYF